ncbi:MAG: chemotaxis protein CheR [Caulobacteraceae bacterium]|nr:chemotaxis protein CheR [Caulobacteraceae bacterium]
MTPHEISVIADLVRRRSGVMVDTDKTYVIETRLAPVARREGFTTIGELIHDLQHRRDEKLVWAAVEAMSSIETQFFRDRIPFDQMRDDILPVLAQVRRTTARVWSLGCSTGQEPYSLAMLADEECGRFPGLKLEIVGGDLSERCLEKAHSGLYTQFEVQRGLPSRLLVKYFDKVDDAWVLAPRIRQMVSLSRLNVLTDVKGQGPFDVIFCRNVLSAFDESTRRSVLERIAGALAEDGYLVLGADETANRAPPAFRPVAARRGLYMRDPAFSVAA